MHEKEGLVEERKVISWYLLCSAARYYSSKVKNKENTYTSWKVWQFETYISD